MNSKKAFSLFEVIIVIFISSIVLIYTFIFTKELYLSNKTNQDLSILKIDLNSTKIILQKNKEKIKDELLFKDSTLYFKDGILLKNVTDFKLKETVSSFKIEIKVNNTIFQTWIINK